jgi:hypothetical protein
MRIRVSALRMLAGLSLLGALNACTEPLPTYLANAAGGTQIVAPGAQAATPLTVSVKDHEGEPMEGVEITWAIKSGAGSISSPTSTTDGDGMSSVTYTAGTTLGLTVITATVPALGATVTYSMTVQ